MKGFTLIELIVVVAISVLLTAGGLAAYRGISEKEAVKQAGLTLESNLKLIQRKALAGEKPDDCVETLQSFRVLPGSDDKTYSVQAQCSLVNGDMVSYNLNEGIKFLSPITVMDFEVLRAGVSGAQTINLTSDSGSFNYQIIIEASGVIRGMLL